MSPQVPASAFSTNKDDFYKLLLQTVDAVIDDSLPLTANLANLSSVIFFALTDPPVGRKINWCGFYLTEDLPAAASAATASVNRRLVLGPFQGRLACTIIPFGRGVCGTAASTLSTQLVPNVHDFPGHIACDSASESEIVVPIKDSQGVCRGVLDIDCLVVNGFDKDDLVGLEAVVNRIAPLFK
ncbi:GAF domain-like protein [Obelidium mucronatum]|nr:GAF domain-like protein [Obelidium mucronatum]